MHAAHSNLRTSGARRAFARETSAALGSRRRARTAEP
jgi:hypothetical protein